MTPRMTVAYSILVAGLAVAALAGIPAFAENRAIGDVVVIIGFAIAIVGAVLIFLAIPSQRRQKAELDNGRAALELNAQIDVDQLRIVRRRLLARKADALFRLNAVQAKRDSWRKVGATEKANGFNAEIKQHEIENADLDAEIDTNANEMRRLGANPDDV